MSPYKLNLFFFAAVFGVFVVGAGYLFSGGFYDGGSFSGWFFTILLRWEYWLPFYMISIAFFALIYWWVEKRVREGYKSAVAYLFVSSLIACLLWAATVFSFMYRYVIIDPAAVATWALFHETFAALLLIGVGLTSMMLFVFGNVFGIILIFQTYRIVEKGAMSQADVVLPVNKKRALFHYLISLLFGGTFSFLFFSLAYFVRQHSPLFYLLYNSPIIILLFICFVIFLILALVRGRKKM